MADGTPAQRKIVHNQTAKRLIIKGRGGKQLILAPLEKTHSMTDAELEPFDQEFLQQNNYVRIIKLSDTKLDGVVTGVLTFGWMAVVGGGAATKDMAPNNKLWISVIGAILLAFIIVLVILCKWKGTRVVMRAATQMLSLISILTIGIALPLAVIYFFGGGHQLIGGQPSLALFGRGMQFIFLVTASLLPALLYFLFDRQQLGTLRQRFDQQIFRLDPNVETLADVRAKYGSQLDEIYGPEEITDAGRLISGTRWPILMATLVITFGWILTLLPVEATPAVDQPAVLSELFVPRRTAIAFGFLGAYFFALHTILRRYTRADLKPKAYTSITVRIFIVIILAWVIDLPFGESNPQSPVGGANLYALAFIFLVGVFPETGLTYIQETLRGKGNLLTRIIPYPKEKHPLTNLVGIDLYDRARLLDEGVTNIESLAHHDLIDLMLETRIPVPRLVDWVDQAILYLHLTVNDAETSQDGPPPAADVSATAGGDGAARAAQSRPPAANKTGREKQKNGSKADEVIALRQCLREYGIRTATDLIKVANEGCLYRVLSERKDEANLNRIKVIKQTLEDDEWLDYLSNWRKEIKIEEEVIPAPASEQGERAAGNGQPGTKAEAGQSAKDGQSAAASPAHTAAGNGEPTSAH